MDAFNRTTPFFEYIYIHFESILPAIRLRANKCEKKKRIKYPVQNLIRRRIEIFPVTC